MGTLHPYVNTATVMPAEPPAPKLARSYQLSKFCLFKFILPSGTFTSDFPQTLSLEEGDLFLGLTLP